MKKLERNLNIHSLFDIQLKVQVEIVFFFSIYKITPVILKNYS